MIVNHANYMILSANANTPFWEHWEAEPYPQWAALTGIAHVPVTPTFAIEPHYHDCDEFWLLIEGDGEAWMDNRVYQYTANTAVYNPMGVIHRNQSFTPGLGSGLLTRLERQKRPGHLHTWEVGPPEPAVPGFVVPGASNTGPFPDRGPRCPLSELRVVSLRAGESAADGMAPRHEYWHIIEGQVHLSIDGLALDLIESDIAIVRGGMSRQIHAVGRARMILARE
jgi:mannose-6-phosphate isomerase-like protein (cupin superfamily)